MKKKQPGMLMGTNVLNRRPVLVQEEDRKEHMHIIGTTGAGKSKLMEWMIREDIKAGRGLCLIDPHGDLYKNVLKYVVRKRLGNKVILIDPNDEEWSVGINYLEHNEYRSHTSHASEVMKGIGKVFGGEDTDTMPRLQRWQRNALIPLIERRLTVVELARFVDPAAPYLRQLVLQETSNPEVIAEWERFDNATKRDRETYIEAVFNRANKFAVSERTRRIFGQVKSTIDFREAMDTGKIILCNLGCDKMSDEEQRMLGVVIIDKIVQAGKSRMNIPERSRRPFYFYLDEFGLYVSEDIAKALRELRKFQVRFILAHQELDQLREDNRKVYSAVMAEPQLKVSFRASREDAELLVGEFFTGKIRPSEKRRIEQTKFRPVETTRIIRTETESEAEVESEGYSEATSETESFSDSSASGVADTYGPPDPLPIFLTPNATTESEMSGSATVSASASMSGRTSGASRMEGRSTSESEVPWYEYHEFKEVSSIEDYSIEEITEKYIAWIKVQGNRHFQLKKGQRPPIPVLAPFVKDAPVRKKDIDALKEKVYSRYAISAKEADEMIEQRRAEFVEEAVASGLIEPEELPELTAQDMRHKVIETGVIKASAELTPEDMREPVDVKEEMPRIGPESMRYKATECEREKRTDRIDTEEYEA